MSARNVPDDWHEYARFCPVCRKIYHASESHGECPRCDSDDWELDEAERRLWGEED